MPIAPHLTPHRALPSTAAAALVFALVFLPAPVLTQAKVAALTTSRETTRPAARTFVLPYLGSAPETGFQYGATLFRVVESADSTTRPSTDQIFASYTAKGQARAFLEVDHWTTRNTWRLTGRVEWQRFPLPYYGIGDDAPAGAEEVYTPRGVIASAAVQRHIGGALYALGGYAYQDISVIRTTDDGVLRQGAIVGSRGGRVGQLRGGLLWDTRDDVFAPYAGALVQATGSLAAGSVGSDFDFRRLVVDARRFVRVGDQRVVAIQGVLEATDGAAPFDQMSLVGGSNYLRGYVHGRYRDRHLASVQAEYRSPLAGRLGWAIFVGGGRIAPTVRDLVSGDARFLPSYGVGARWQLFDRSRSTIRVDYGRGVAGQSGLYVALNEAF